MKVIIQTIIYSVLLFPSPIFLCFYFFATILSYGLFKTISNTNFEPKNASANNAIATSVQCTARAPRQPRRFLPISKVSKVSQLKMVSTVLCHKCCASISSTNSMPLTKARLNNNQLRVSVLNSSCSVCTSGVKALSQCCIFRFRSARSCSQYNTANSAAIDKLAYANNAKLACNYSCQSEGLYRCVPQAQLLSKHKAAIGYTKMPKADSCCLEVSATVIADIAKLIHDKAAKKCRSGPCTASQYKLWVVPCANTANTAKACGKALLKPDFCREYQSPALHR